MTQGQPTCTPWWPHSIVSLPVVCSAQLTNQSFQLYAIGTPAGYFEQPESQPNLEELHSSISDVKEPVRAKDTVFILRASEAHTLTARAMPAVVRPDVLSLPFQRFPQSGFRHQRQLVRSSMANSLFWGAVGRTVKCSETMPLASENICSKIL